ncbi:MAG: hypothetical protein NC483_06955 [Ruminococcus sp.]|nr:hypothetical protein [Ruminococcus sp.]
MRKYIEEYISELEFKIVEKKRFSEKDKIKFKDKIVYFQHERLIHLLVTLFFVIFTFIFLALGMISYVFLIPFGIGIIFLLFYIIHYFFLEKTVQYMYKLYDKIFK